MLQQPPDVAQLMQALQQQQQQIAQLQQFAAAQQVQLAPAAPASHRVERPKLPSPPSFDGKGALLDEWESAIRKQLNWYRTPASDELAVAEAFLTGAAYDWWKHLLLASKAAVIDFASLVAALRARFQPVTTAELARLQLSKLAQGKAAVHDYISAFRRLLTPLTSMAEEDRLFAFMRGLRSDIATQLRVHWWVRKISDRSPPASPRLSAVSCSHSSSSLKGRRSDPSRSGRPHPSPRSAT